ncbi:MAG: hypothetical protein QW112_03975 [Candidatus Micrarchaeia archaeon]
MENAATAKTQIGTEKEGGKGNGEAHEREQRPDTGEQSPRGREPDVREIMGGPEQERDRRGEEAQESIGLDTAMLIEQRRKSLLYKICITVFIFILSISLVSSISEFTWDLRTAIAGLLVFSRTSLERYI